MNGLAAIEQALATAALAGVFVREPSAAQASSPIRSPRDAGPSRRRPGVDHLSAPDAVEAVLPEAGSLLSIPVGYKPFSIGALGNFPFYWQDPANLRFNAKTYQWITAGLKARSNPVQLDGVFTNRFTDVLSTICYTLSTADQDQLDKDQAAASDQQRELLQAWLSAFGALPSDAAGSPVINLIMEEITNQWAAPATDLNELLDAANPSVLLNKTPPAGQPVVATLKHYLSTIASSVPLLNQVTRNTGLCSRALAALQTPTLANGALALSDGRLMPAYTVQTSVDDILAGLAATTIGRTIRLVLALSSPGDGALDVSINRGVTARVPASEILKLEPIGSGDIVSSILMASDVAGTVTADFLGTTTVSFAPANFSTETLRDWFWTEPIRQALKNGKSDVSGFKFAPEPPFDLSENGPVGCVTSVIISRNPSINVQMSLPHMVKLADAVKNTAGAELSFLGRSLGTLGADDGYELAKVPSAAGDQVTLQPAADGISGINIDSRAFVLAVKTEFLVM